jgi:AmmeMemoRadiSam system protein A
MMFPSPESFSAAAPAPALESLPPEGRATLLAIARKSIEARLTGTQFTPPVPCPRLLEPRGVFVSLYRDDALRGCIGYPFAGDSLHRAVAEAAVGAALQDPRFPAVTLEELPHARIALSLLSPMFDLKPEQIEVGRHGLMVTLGSARGLLLPQVAVEHAWSAPIFLENTCMKAGLPRDAWKVARLEGFIAEVFEEGRQHATT